MLELAGDHRLGEHAPLRVVAAHLRPQRLDRDLAAERHLPRHAHDAHAALAELATERELRRRAVCTRGQQARQRGQAGGEAVVTALRLRPQRLPGRQARGALGQLALPPMLLERGSIRDVDGQHSRHKRDDSACRDWAATIGPRRRARLGGRRGGDRWSLGRQLQ